MAVETNIETFENPSADRDYEIKIDCPEFTSVCPRTGQPDFGIIRIVYCPDQKCVELKSLKLYLQSYRNEGVFYEAAMNRVIDDLVRACEPRHMKVTGEFSARGGITTSVNVEYPWRTPS